MAVVSSMAPIHPKSNEFFDTFWFADGRFPMLGFRQVANAATPSFFGGLC